MNDNFFKRPVDADLNPRPVTSGKRPADNGSSCDAVADDAFGTASATLDCDTAFLDLLSTHYLICNENIKAKGEDSGFEAYTCEAGLIGAFDGCGGLGAKTCPSVSGKTEAYLASRAVGAAARQWFYSQAATGYQWNIDTLKNQILSNLKLCQQQTADSGSMLLGSMVRPFPSTIAAITFQIVNKKLVTQHIWAGDSRTYVLDKDGLGQISIDDIKGLDAMSNLTKDSPLTNVLSGDGRFQLHCVKFSPKHPCIMFCATDGCFGYLSSPMAFEWMILSTLVKAPNAAQWQQLLNDSIVSHAGDDQTLAVAAFGFDSFIELKKYYFDRYCVIERIVKEFDRTDPDSRQHLWETYKPNYYRYTVEKRNNNGSNTNQ